MYCLLLHTLLSHAWLPTHTKIIQRTSTHDHTLFYLLGARVKIIQTCLTFKKEGKKPKEKNQKQLVIWFWFAFTLLLQQNCRTSCILETTEKIVHLSFIQIKALVVLVKNYLKWQEGQLRNYSLKRVDTFDDCTIVKNCMEVAPCILEI